MGRTGFEVIGQLWKIIDKVFPPCCGGCDLPGTNWCHNCALEITPVFGARCQKCNSLLSDDGICENCSHAYPCFDEIRSYAIYAGPIRHAIHKLKFKNDIGLGYTLAKMLLDEFVKTDWKIDLVVPVPLSKARFRQRGYNQAAVIAYPFSLAANLQYSSKILIKKKETISQIHLSKHDRKTNVAGSFWVNSNKIMGKRILVVDDVTTTGSTLNACAETLLHAGVSNVYCLTLAKAEVEQGIV
jgi:competence protein ComFC